ncbi:MAG TPA: PEP/pyruvate-binding domain-containing protein [Actinopolymorphaceae bacterium]
MTDLVVALDDGSADLTRVGGKGASLARLARAGLPVPPGFHVTTDAYHRFVAAHGLQQPILDALRNEPDDAAQRIAKLFAAHAVPADIDDTIRRAYAELGEVPVAVRSSATAEDLPDASFAGQQETFLDVRDGDALVDAVKRCWASLWTGRAIAYRSRQGISHAEVGLAVVVQQMVSADHAGVLFTADPVTGNRRRLVVNAVRGLGEALVSGEADPQVLVVDRATHDIVERSGEPFLTDDDTVRELIELGLRIERLYGCAMDIEWAVDDSALAVLQARPVTVQTYEEWNDSLRGDSLWTNANLGEAVPDVMTPATWSFLKLFMADGMATSSVPGFVAYGNIGGRFYMNLSMLYSLAVAFGMKRQLGSIDQVFGKLPPGTEVPLVPLSRVRVIRALLPVLVRALRRIRRNTPRIADFVATSPERCDELRAEIRSTRTPADLARLWRTTIEPFFHESCFMLEAAGRQDGGALVTVRQKLTKLVGEADMNAMTSGAGVLDGELESLGPLLGLARVRTGEIDADTYLRRYGHRSASEFEISIPRPAEDPTWLDRQRALSESTTPPDELVARQEAASRDAWRRFAERYPRKVRRMRRQVARWARAAHDRELTRSEVARLFWVVREFVLRAGELTGVGDGMFFLDREEILAVLDGDSAILDGGVIDARRATYERYKALPNYPTIINGRFDPIRWAADPDRRHDVYDEQAAAAPAHDAVVGFPGAAGVVEGVVRVLSSVDEAEQLRPGEVLVTTVTNIGWTPIFPRAAAVVTDVGAPLSHAAIVARELGIPAVVGSGNATTRLRTGDLVRVDGSRGTVELVSSGERTPTGDRLRTGGEQGLVG